MTHPDFKNSFERTKAPFMFSQKGLGPDADFFTVLGEEVSTAILIGSIPSLNPYPSRGD
jgi:hypothetical protein